MLNWLARLDAVIHQRFDRALNLGPEERPSAKLLTLFSIAILMVSVVFGVNLLFNRDGYGPWGDFIGGVLNPLLTFLTFVGLLLTIVLQQTELREARQEFHRSADALEQQNTTSRRQNFESTLFGMLTLHSTILRGVEAYSKAEGQTVRGHRAFHPMYTELSDFYQAAKKVHATKLADIDIARLAYQRFWSKYQPTISHYVRYIYNVIRFSKENSPSIVEHIRLIRSQISDYELLYIFYNCVTPKGYKFKLLAEEFALFDNLPEHFLDPKHKQFVAPSAFGRQGPPTRDAATPISASYYAAIARRIPPAPSTRKKRTAASRT